MAAATAPLVSRPNRRDSDRGADPALRREGAGPHRPRRARRCSGSSRRSGSSSRRSCPRQSFASKGWWQIFSKPSLATWSNYDALFHNHGAACTALEDDGRDRRRQHAARRHHRRARRLRVRVARVPRPRLDLHRRDRAARRAAADGADPDVHALRHLRPLRHRARDHPLPRRVRAAVRDLPVAQLLRRDPEGHPRVGAHRRRLRDPDLRAADPAARPAGDRLARDLPVPLDVERPDRRADVRAERAADHGRGSSASCASSARTST